MTTYYVDASSSLASDKNTGLSADTPFASLAAVNRLNLQPGDTVAFKAGTTYASTAAGSGALVVKAVGTLDKPITFTSYGEGDAPIIKNLATGYSDGVQLVGAKYVTIDGLNITGGAQAGINVDKNSSHIQIQNVEASGVGEGVLLNGTNSLVTHSYFHDLKMIKNTSNVYDDDYGAVGVTIGGSNNEISFNKIVNAAAPSYDYGMDGGGIELFGNVSNVAIHDNWVQNSIGFIEAGGSKSSMSNITITNNVSLNNGTFLDLHNGGGQFASTFSNIDVSRNTIVNENSKAKDMAVVFLDAAYQTGQLNFHDNAVYLNSGDSVFKQTGNYHSNNTFYLASSVTHLYNNWTMTLNAGESFGKLTGTSSGAALVDAVEAQSGRGATLTTAAQTGLPAVVVPAVAAVVAPLVAAAVPAAIPLVTDTYGITGQSYVSEHKVLDASGNVVLLQRFHADGSMDYSQVVGTDGTVTSQYYDASGALLRQVVANSDGSQTVDVYHVTGQSYTTQHITYDARGAVTSLSQYHADGTKDYTTVLNADGSTTALRYDATGTLTTKIVTAASGSSVTTSFDAKGAVTDTVATNAAGIQTSAVHYLAGGTESSATSLNADGSTTALKYDATGTLTTKSVTAASGSSVTTSFDAKGAVTDTVATNAAGIQTSAVHFHADGTKDYATSLNADGSTTASKYDATGTLAATTVTAASGSSMTTWFDPKGVVTDTIAKNAAGVQTSTVHFHADGTKDYATSLNADGSTTASKYDATGHLAVNTVTAATGSSVMTWFDTKGVVTDTVEKNAAGVQISTVHFHADGTKDYATSLSADGSTTALKYDATGILALKTVTAASGSSVMTSFDTKGAVTDTVEKNAAGIQTSQIHYHADGTEDFARILNSDGSTSALKYDATGKLSVETITQKDGSFVQNTYNPSGTIAVSAATHKDGSQDVYQFNIEGKSYSESHVSYDASKHIQFNELFNNDGTHTVSVAAANVTVAATAAKDTFIAYGADTFKFGTGSGKDTIYSFHAGDTASHDTISLSKSVASDFAHLSMHQAGADVVIDLSAQDSITLKSVSLAALTHHDFLFV